MRDPGVAVSDVAQPYSDYGVLVTTFSQFNSNEYHPP